jgi:hypothetical protein
MFKGKIDYTEAHAGDFRHDWIIDKTASLVEKVDRHFGGWPVQFKQLMFSHCERRTMEFSTGGPNTGWWTTVLTDKEYYRFKCGAPAPEDLKDIKLKAAYLSDFIYRVIK